MVAKPLSNENLPVGMRERWYNASRFEPDNPWSDFNASSAAVVLVDLINWQAHPEGASIQALRAGGSHAEADFIVERCTSTVLPNLVRVLDAARSAGVRVVHARLASSKSDYGDITPAMQSYLRDAGASEGSWGSKVLDGLEREGDLSVVKTGSGAFASSGLNQTLRDHGISTLLYAGVVTNACVMLTAAAGFDLGYRQYLVTDCTAALSEEDQSDAVRFMDAFMAQAVTAADAVAAFEATTSATGG